MPATHRRQRQHALPLVLALTLVATLTATLMTVAASPADAVTRRVHKIHHALRVARHQIGDPYRYGADGPNAFDCSGLTDFSFRRADLRLPRTAGQQYRHVRHIKKKNIRRGDLVFFHSGSYVYHVGIFTGNWRDGRRVILHAPYSGQRVHRERIWTSHWWAGTLRRR